MIDDWLPWVAGTIFIFGSITIVYLVSVFIVTLIRQRRSAGEPVERPDPFDWPPRNLPGPPELTERVLPPWAGHSQVELVTRIVGPERFAEMPCGEVELLLYVALEAHQDGFDACVRLLGLRDELPAQDSNLKPSGSKPDATANCATGH